MPLPIGTGYPNRRKRTAATLKIGDSFTGVEGKGADFSHLLSPFESVRKASAARLSAPT
jgi:hypothetical protein